MKGWEILASINCLQHLLLAQNNYEIPLINQTRTPNAQHRLEQFMAQMKAFEVKKGIMQNPEMVLTALV